MHISHSIANNLKQREFLSMALVCLGVFFFSSSIYVCIPTLPLLSQSLGASMLEVGVIVGAYGFTQFLFRFPIGLLGDRFGRHKVFILAGVLCVILGSLGLYLSKSPAHLIISRAILGVAASTWVSQTLLFSNYFSSGQETWAISLIVFSSNFALIVSTLAGGGIAEDYGLIAPCYIALALAALSFFIFCGVQEKPTIANQENSLRRLAVISKDRRLIKTSAVASIGHYVVYASIFTFLPLHASQIGASRFQIGEATSIFQVCCTLAGLAVAPLVRRWGDRLVIMVGIILLTIGTFLMPSISSYHWLLIDQCICGLGTGVVFPALMAVSIKNRPSHEKGAAMGFFQAAYAIGMFAGPSLSGVIADAVGLSGAFYSVGVISLVALLLSTRIDRQPGMQYSS